MERLGPASWRDGELDGAFHEETLVHFQEAWERIADAATEPRTKATALIAAGRFAAVAPHNGTAPYPPDHFTVDSHLPGSPSREFVTDPVPEFETLELEDDPLAAVVSLTGNDHASGEPQLDEIEVRIARALGQRVRHA